MPIPLNYGQTLLTRRQFALGREPVPEDVRDLPEIGGRGGLQEWLNADYAKRAYGPQEVGIFARILQALSAPQHALMSGIRELIRVAKGEAQTDPLSAAFRGFKAAFNDDTEYQARTWQVLEELGLAPEEGTTRSKVTSALAFLSDIVVDPLMLLTIGPAARAMKISGKTIAKLASDAKLDLPRHLQRAFFVNKTGEKMIAGVSAKRGKSAIEAVRQKGGGPKEIATALMDQGIADETVRDFAILGLPTEGWKVADALAVKSPKRIQEFLEELPGRRGAVTRQEIEDFAVRGYKEYFDWGGLKIGLGRHKASFFAPRAVHDDAVLSEHLGRLVGHRLKTGTPITSQIAAKVVESRFWTKPADWVAEVTKPLRDKFVETFAPLSRLEAGERLALRGLEKQQVRYRAEGIREAAHLARDLTPKEERLAKRLLLRARKEGHMEGDVTVWAAKLLREPDEKVKAWFGSGEKGLNLPHGLADDRIKLLSERLQEMQAYDHDMLMVPERQSGVLNAVRDAYSAKMYVNWSQKEYRKNPSRWTLHNWWDTAEVYHMDWDDAHDAWRRHELPGPLDDRYSVVQAARIESSLRSRGTIEWMNQIMRTIGRKPYARREILAQLQDPKWVEKYPVPASMLAHYAAQQGVPGVEISQLAEWDKLISNLHSTVRRPDAAEDLIRQFREFLASPEGGPLNLSDANIDDLMGQLDEVIRVRRDTIALAEARGIPETVEHQKEVLKVLEEAAPKLRADFAGRKVEGAFGRAAEQARDLAREAMGPGPVWQLPSKLRGIYASIRIGKPRSVLGLDRAERGKAINELMASYAPQLDGAELQAVTRLGNEVHRRLGKLETTVRAVENQWKAFKALPPGVRAGAAEIGRTLDTAQKGITSRLEAILTETARMGAAAVRRPRRSAADIAKLELLEIEHRTLQEARRSLPAPAIGETWTDFARELFDRRDIIAQIRTKAKQIGVERELSAVVAMQSTKKPLEALAMWRLKSLRDDVLTPGFRRRARDYLYAKPPETEELLPLVQGTSMRIRDAVTGRWGDAEKLLGGNKDFVNAFAALSEVDLNDRSMFWVPFDAAASFMRRFLTASMAPLVIRPGFYIRNVLDNALRSAMGFGFAALTPWRSGFRDSVRALMKSVPDGAPLLSKGLPIQTIGEYRSVMKEIGFWAEDMPLLDVVEPTPIINWMHYGDSPLARGAAAVYHPMRAMKLWAAERIEKTPILRHYGVGRLGADLENLTAGNALLFAMQSGRPLAHIADDMQRFLFYYGGMSAFEKNVMRRAFLFWSFQRNAIPFAAWSVMKRPDIVAAWPKLRDMQPMTREDEALLPEWVKDYPFVTLGKTDGGGFRIQSLRNIFSIDVLPEALRFFESSRDGAEWSDTFTQLNPVFLAPIELVMGRQFYLRKDIPPRKYLVDRLQDVENSPLWPIPPFMASYLEAEDAVIQGQRFTAVNGERYHFLTRMWFSRLFRELDDARDWIQGRLGTADFAGIAFGFKSIQLERERQVRLLATEAERNWNAYKQARRRGDRTEAMRLIDELRW